MPECFFLYYEEIDWSMMFTRAGYEIWYDPSCTVYHKESQTTGQNSPLRTYYITRNRLLLVKRNYKGINKYLSYIYLIYIVATRDINQIHPPRQIRSSQNLSAKELSTINYKLSINDMDFWIILYIIDWILFIPVAGTVLYLGIFSVASLFTRDSVQNTAKIQNRFAIIIPSHKQDNVIEQTVVSILSQDYPQRMFDVVVVSDHQSEITNMRLAQYPITLLTPDFVESTKAKSLQYAILKLPEFKIYDIALVLDADNIVEQDFLTKVNDAFETAATKAIQMHRISRNRDTAAARMGSIFEEINNNIFSFSFIFTPGIPGGYLFCRVCWGSVCGLTDRGTLGALSLPKLPGGQAVFVRWGRLWQGTSRSLLLSWPPSWGYRLSALGCLIPAALFWGKTFLEKGSSPRPPFQRLLPWVRS